MHLWRVVGRGLDPQDDLVLQRMGVLVAGEQHVWVLQQLTPEKMSEKCVNNCTFALYCLNTYVNFTIPDNYYLEGIHLEVIPSYKYNCQNLSTSSNLFFSSNFPDVLFRKSFFQYFF